MRPGSWLPPALWMAAILWLSSAAFSAETTGSLLQALLQSIWGAVDPATLAAVHAVVRKLAHVAVYAILALLWWRALRREGLLAPAVAPWAALVISAAWAAVDETHQSTVPSRTGSVVDVAIDTVGAALAMVAARVATAAHR